MNVSVKKKKRKEKSAQEAFRGFHFPKYASPFGELDVFAAGKNWQRII